jgi:hypothetical protein
MIQGEQSIDTREFQVPMEEGLEPSPQLPPTPPPTPTGPREAGDLVSGSQSLSLSSGLEAPVDLLATIDWDIEMSRVVDSRRGRVLGSKWGKLMRLRTKMLDRVKVAFTRVLGAFDTGATGCTDPIIIYVERQVRYTSEVA